MITKSSNYSVHRTRSHFVVLIFILCIYVSLILSVILPVSYTQAPKYIMRRCKTDASLMNGVEHLLRYVLVMCVFYLDECLFRSVWVLAYLLIGLFVELFFATEFYECFIYYGHINPLIIVR